MWLEWLPWRYIVRHAARSHGFIDPISIMSRLHRFAQPSEVAAPIELLRAGMVFHARGLINTRAIQHNLDWVWPYWVERQFDPLDNSFVPRAFSITHVNLTHRNWTAVGIPDCLAMPIVDPRGLVTPFFDGWSIDGWILSSRPENAVIPSQMPCALQQLILGHDRLSVVTTSSVNTASQECRSLRIEAEVVAGPVCRINFQAAVRRAQSEPDQVEPAEQLWLVIALRPYNPEGISFIHKVALGDDRRSWVINQRRCAEFSRPVERHAVSKYRDGDVYLSLPGGAKGTGAKWTKDAGAKAGQSIECDVGLATAAALFEIPPEGKCDISLKIRLSDHYPSSRSIGCPDNCALSWSDSLKGVSRVDLPDAKFQFLYDAALRTLILHSPGEVYPGPYTYKRFWFRDAAFILQAMLCVGMKSRVQRSVERFLVRQTRSGFFRSQEGEWDSNGEALWIMHRLCELGGFEPPSSWRKVVFKGGRWIKQKLLSDKNNSLQAGLLPAGFSAEHLGPNDYYYWDDFWGVAGLSAAGSMMKSLGDLKTGRAFEQEAKALNQAIERSLNRLVANGFSSGPPNSGPTKANFGAIPASPYRRMDAGAIGSIVASYPLRLWPVDDQRVLATVNYLLEACLVKGAFFQDMIHSGLNAYLTLHLAQVLLRSEDTRFYDLLRAVADLASPTGQWPEAIHPKTLGGCMGDGQHVWAAAEWIMMIRNMFVREEGDRLILASGLVAEWLDQTLTFGPTPTPYGEISLKIEPQPGQVTVAWSACWRGQVPVMEIRIPGLEPLLIEPRPDARPSQNKAEIPLDNASWC